MNAGQEGVMVQMDPSTYEAAVVELFVRRFRPPQFVVEPSLGGRCTRLGQITKGPRQLDVAVFRAGALATPFLVVDAKRRSRPVDVNGVGAFLSLLDDVGAEFGAIVAVRGFSKKAVAIARQRVNVHVLTLEEAERLDWLRIGRQIYPRDWAFHAAIGESLRLIETNAEHERVSEGLDQVPFEEWDALIAEAMANHRDEAEVFLNWIAWSHHNDGWRYNAVRHLIEHGSLEGEQMARLLENEQDQEVRELLMTASSRDFA